LNGWHGHLDPVHWVTEGRGLAVKVAYRNVELNEAGELLQNVNRKNVSHDREYPRPARDLARDLAREQVVLDGIRLASLLR
jgi:hypothetical protein